MMKVIGAVLVLSSALAAGVSGIMKMKTRVNSLRALISALELMKAEICERLTPLPELISILEAETSGPAKRFFSRCGEKLCMLGSRSFASIWREVAEQSREMELKSSEIAALADLGAVIGRYDAEQQRGAIDFAARRFEIFLSKAEQETATQGKTRTALGVAFALMTVIILI